MEDLIFEPIITEKSIALGDKRKYLFKVNKEANKSEIKKEIAKVFKVKVKDVNIICQKNKKKAIVTLEKGQKIKELEMKK